MKITATLETLTKVGQAESEDQRSEIYGTDQPFFDIEACLEFFELGFYEEY